MSERTATDIMMQKRMEDISERRFNLMAQDFFRRWQPEDREEAARFSADLFTLIREVYADSMKPLGETMKLAFDVQSIKTHLVKRDD